MPRTPVCTLSSKGKSSAGNATRCADRRESVCGSFGDRTCKHSVSRLSRLRGIDFKFRANPQSSIIQSGRSAEALPMSAPFQTSSHKRLSAASSVRHDPVNLDPKVSGGSLALNHRVWVLSSLSSSSSCRLPCVMNGWTLVLPGKVHDWTLGTYKICPMARSTCANWRARNSICRDRP